MKSKYLLSLVIFIVFISLLVSCRSSTVSYINENDSINNSDEKIIKEFRSHQNYSSEELKNLDIKYLGEVDGYKIYFVPFKGSSGVINESSWTKDEYTFPVESHTRIIGVKNKKLFTLGNLIYETSINIGVLYNMLPNEYK